MNSALVGEGGIFQLSLKIISSLTLPGPSFFKWYSPVSLRWLPIESRCHLLGGCKVTMLTVVPILVPFC